MALSAQALCVLGGSGIGLKDEIGVSGSSEDTRLERLIESASAQIARYCGVPSFHYESAREEDHRGYGTPILHVDKVPLLSITSIVYDPQDADETVDSDGYLLDSSEEGRIYRAAGWLWTAAAGRAIGVHYMPGTEESLYRVTFAGGYVTRNQVAIDDDLDTMTLPEDLEDACIMLASMRYRWAPRSAGVKSEKMLSWSATYRDDGGMPPEVAAMIDPWRKAVWA